jgi:amino-acid N-acetyltransferase
MDIRRITPDDLQKVISLLDAAGLPVLPRHLPLSNILVALESDTVIGLVALEVCGLRGLVRSVAVEPQHTRRGVGTSLLQSLLARAQELSLRELYLITEGAEKFFSNAGFTPVARDHVPDEIRSTSAYGEQYREDATVMRFRLTARHV